MKSFYIPIYRVYEYCRLLIFCFSKSFKDLTNDPQTLVRVTTKCNKSRMYTLECDKRKIEKQSQCGYCIKKNKTPVMGDFCYVLFV